VRILYVLGSLQHPSIVRGALRHYHFLRLLARQHSITLLVRSRLPPSEEVVAELGRLVDRLIVVPVDQTQLGSASGRFGRKLRHWAAVRRMRNEFRALVRDETFDVLLFHGKDVFPVIADFQGLPTVIDFCDATTLRQREQLRHTKALSVPWRLAGYATARHTERRLIKHSPHLLFISRRDRDAVLGGGSSAAILPNGIDLDYWTPKGIVASQDRLVFTGVMNYAPNEDAALLLIQRILPLLRRSRPNLALDLVGLDPTPAVLGAARGVPGVTVTGFVEDLRPYLEQAAVYVAPIRYASGQQNKILEAMAMKVPVVTTPVVAGGLRVHDDALPIRIASQPEEFANEVIALLEDAAERRRLTEAGRQFVEEHFDWERGAHLLAQVCAQAASHTEALAQQA
jgi:glycosyltransferase involved in cell wall biosynthesis